MKNHLKRAILDNQFAIKVRTEGVFDQIEYNKLCKSLKQLAHEISSELMIDKKLALTLYYTPVVVRNSYLSFAKNENPHPITNQLEDAWVELDQLVMNCFTVE